MKKFILDCFTGSDNKTMDVGRVLWVLGTLVFLICEILNHKTFDEWKFSQAFGFLLVAGAGALKLKQSTEPK